MTLDEMTPLQRALTGAVLRDRWARAYVERTTEREVFTLSFPGVEAVLEIPGDRALALYDDDPNELWRLAFR